MPRLYGPHWLAYFKISDRNGTAAKAQQLGASVYVTPMNIEGLGGMAVLADPEGAVFAVFQQFEHP